MMQVNQILNQENLRSIVNIDNGTLSETAINPLKEALDTDIVASEAQIVQEKPQQILQESAGDAGLDALKSELTTLINVKAQGQPKYMLEGAGTAFAGAISQYELLPANQGDSEAEGVIFDSDLPLIRKELLGDSDNDSEDPEMRD